MQQRLLTMRLSCPTAEGPSTVIRSLASVQKLTQTALQSQQPNMMQVLLSCSTAGGSGAGHPVAGQCAADAQPGDATIHCAAADGRL